jgi:hypothetical protein
MPHRVIAVITDALEGEEPVQEMSRSADGGSVELRIVVPAVEAGPLKHTLGDVDEPRQIAKRRLEASLRNLRANGIEASGEVGDPDPVQAAQDALLKAPADEILFFEYEQDQQRWFEGGMFEQAKAALEPPLRMVVLDGDRSDEHVVAVESAAAGTVSEVEHEVGGDYVPGLSRADLIGMVAGIVGTIVAIILAAIAVGGNSATGWPAAAIAIAIFTAIANMAHVVGLTMMDAVNYRGTFVKLFRTLAVVGTPIAVLVNLAIVLFA